jgi:hypothetical protein
MDVAAVLVTSSASSAAWASGMGLFMQLVCAALGMSGVLRSSRRLVFHHNPDQTCKIVLGMSPRSAGFPEAVALCSKIDEGAAVYWRGV